MICPYANNQNECHGIEKCAMPSEFTCGIKVGVALKKLFDRLQDAKEEKDHV